MQDCAGESRRAKRVVDVVWNPFVGLNVDERITEVSMAITACSEDGKRTVNGLYSEDRAAGPIGPLSESYGFTHIDTN